jgi:hypothetical protein
VTQILVLAEGTYHYSPKQWGEPMRTAKVFIVDWTGGRGNMDTATVIFREPADLQGEALPVPVGAIREITAAVRDSQFGATYLIVDAPSADVTVTDC